MPSITSEGSPNPLRLPWHISGDSIQNIDGIYLARSVSNDGGAWNRSAPAIVAAMNALFYHHAALAALGRPPEWTDPHLRHMLRALCASAVDSTIADETDVRGALERAAREERREP